MLQESDVLVTIAGAKIGQCGFIRPEHVPANTNQAVGIVRVAADKAVSRYVYYFFKQESTYSLIQSLGGQAAQPNLNLAMLKKLAIPVPTLQQQKRIADALSAYDDLIENNRRRMRLLEDAVRQLYQEWFVRLRFPGYEHTRIVDGVPEGWERKRLGDICADNRDVVEPSEMDPETPYIGLEHMPRRSISLTDWGSVEDVSSSKLRFRDSDFLFGKIRPYFHKVGIAFVDGVVSSDAFVIRPTQDEFRYLVLMTISSDPFVASTSQSMREGSKMPRADWKQMAGYPVAVPPRHLLDTFSRTLGPIVEQLKNLTLQNHKLRAARDLLLPRLMTGEIAV